MRTLTARLLRKFLYGQDFTSTVNGKFLNNEETRDFLKQLANQEINFKQTHTLHLKFNT